MFRKLVCNFKVSLCSYIWFVENFPSYYHNNQNVLWYLKFLYTHYDLFLPYPHFGKLHFLCLVQRVHCDRFNACDCNRRINYYFFLFSDHAKIIKSQQFYPNKVYISSKSLSLIKDILTLWGYRGLTFRTFIVMAKLMKW